MMCKNNDSECEKLNRQKNESTFLERQTKIVKKIINIM